MKDFTLRDKRLSGYTYIMSNELGLIKVGKSNNPEQRRKDIEALSGLPVKLELKVRGDFKEHIAHEILKEYNTVGEWFKCPLDYAIKVLEELENVSDEIIYSKMLNYTKSELKEILNVRLNELVDFAGGYVYLAKMLNISSSTTQGWVKRGQISKQGAILVSKHKDLRDSFPADYIRPDL